MQIHESHTSIHALSKDARSIRGSRSKGTYKLYMSSLSVRPLTSKKSIPFGRSARCRWGKLEKTRFLKRLDISDLDGRSGNRKQLRAALPFSRPPAVPGHNDVFIGEYSRARSATLFHRRHVNVFTPRTHVRNAHRAHVHTRERKYARACARISTY